ncbi:hypothetical protein HPP92_000371 [Vanilla planifolia]|uniref:Uncharacterized protein n=1 Tax=Vanilla planifolia TaxID=51239 RepID=A0A835RNP7_VANPL|nr:hypothetical protein HPP92_000371 [Vanilla planifolia]
MGDKYDKNRVSKKELVAEGQVVALWHNGDLVMSHPHMERSSADTIVAASADPELQDPNDGYKTFTLLYRLSMLTILQLIEAQKHIGSMLSTNANLIPDQEMKHFIPARKHAGMPVCWTGLTPNDGF